MHPVFIINPVSGKRRNQDSLFRQIETFMAKKGWNGQINRTAATGHATQLAIEAIEDGCDSVVAVGGDGTFNEVGRALRDSGIPLGLIPNGSGNGLARHLGIPLDCRQALEVIAGGRTVVMDSGSADGQPFFNVMGFGFDAEIGHRFNALSKRGPLPYFTTAGAHFLSYKPERFHLTNGNQTHEITAWIVAVGNGSQYGNNARITPRAKVTDGKLDLTAVSMDRRSRIMGLTWQLFRGTLDRNPCVLSWQGGEFTIERECPGIFHTDGEIIPASNRVSVKVYPSSVKVFIP